MLFLPIYTTPVYTAATKALVPATNLYTVYRFLIQLNRIVFSHALKVLTEISVDCSAASKLFHVDGLQTAKLLLSQDVFVHGTDSWHIPFIYL